MGTIKQRVVVWYPVGRGGGRPQVRQVVAINRKECSFCRRAVAQSIASVGCGSRKEQSNRELPRWKLA